MTFRLLYVPSLHAMQEQDDCITWRALGIDFFSTGYLRTQRTIGDMPYVHMPMRGLSMRGCKAAVWGADAPNTLMYKKNMDFAGTSGYNIWKFSSSFLRNFDAILCCHFPFTIILNWEDLCMQNKVMIIKTFGMQLPEWEPLFKELRSRGVYIVRNSPVERKYVQNYCGHDAIIRGSCVVSNWHKWKGTVPKCLTLSNMFGHPAGARRKELYEKIKQLSSSELELYGAANDNVEYSLGFLSYKKKIEKLTRYYVNLIVGTPGANNTFSVVEALMVGQPSVIFNRTMWGCRTFEVEDLVENGKHAFLIGSPEEGAEVIDKLMHSPKTRRYLSKNARKLAHSIWGRSTLCKQWKAFFNNIGLQV